MFDVEPENAAHRVSRVKRRQPGHLPRPTICRRNSFPSWMRLLNCSLIRSCASYKRPATGRTTMRPDRRKPALDWPVSRRGVAPVSGLAETGLHPFLVALVRDSASGNYPVFDTAGPSGLSHNRYKAAAPAPKSARMRRWCALNNTYRPYRLPARYRFSCRISCRFPLRFPLRFAFKWSVP